MSANTSVSCVPVSGRVLLTLMSCLLAAKSALGQTPVDLTPYYVTYAQPESIFSAGDLYPEYRLLPVEWTTAMGYTGTNYPSPTLRNLQPPANAVAYVLGALRTINYLPEMSIRVGALTDGGGPLTVLRRTILGPEGGPCVDKFGSLPNQMALPTKVKAGSSIIGTTTVLGLPTNPVYSCFDTAISPGQWNVTDRLSFGALIRRTTISGHEYEASPMVMQRNGVPWMTYYFAYRIGIAGGESNWVESSRSAFAADFPKFPSSAENFELTTLPPPIIEGEVVEFVNAKVSPASVGGHYFYASSAEDKAALDASDDWIRTGRQFKSGGYVPVCRFLYKAPGSSAGTHFFTAKADECAQFKTMPGFTYEGTPFRASLPAAPVAGVAADSPTRCPPKTVPLYRFFNNPAAGSYLPNHRYLTNRAAGQVTGYAGPGKPAQTWADEGIALCVAG